MQRVYKARGRPGCGDSSGHDARICGVTRWPLQNTRRRVAFTITHQGTWCCIQNRAPITASHTPKLPGPSRPGAVWIISVRRHRCCSPSCRQHSSHGPQIPRCCWAKCHCHPLPTSAVRLLWWGSSVRKGSGQRNRWVWATGVCMQHQLPVFTMTALGPASTRKSPAKMVHRRRQEES
jgi:hypothetical protein